MRIGVVQAESREGAGGFSHIQRSIYPAAASWRDDQVRGGRVSEAGGAGVAPNPDFSRVEGSSASGFVVDKEVGSGTGSIQDARSEINYAADT